MILYAVIMLAAACSFFLLGRAVYGGNTSLIHDYHQKKVKDKAAYGKAMGKALLLMGLSMAASGIAALFTEGFAPVALLLAGLLMGILQLVRVQKKYNNGVF